MLLPSWDCAATDSTLSNGRRTISLQWTSPTLFAVNAVVTLWPASAAVDSLIKFSNHNTSHNSPLLTEACALDTAWNLPADAMLETSLGSISSARDFTAVSAAMTAGTTLTFRPDDYYDGPNRIAAAGRSSNGKMPFWALESQSRGAGLFIGLGWSGQWNATFTSSPTNTTTTTDRTDGGCGSLPRPRLPCPPNWWDNKGVCMQGCPLAAQSLFGFCLDFLS